MFGKDWQPARGTIVASRTLRTTGDGMVSIYEFVVDVRTAEGELFRTKVPEPKIATDFKDPAVGDVVRVEVDPRSHDVRFDKHDPALSWKAYRAAQDQAFDQTLRQPPSEST